LKPLQDRYTIWYTCDFPTATL